MTIQDAMNTAVLLPYQKLWILDKALVKVWEKSRRIGASYVEALNCVIIAMISKSAGGMNCYYLSYSKEMTQQFINDCAFWAHILGIACSDMEEVVVSDEDKDIMVYRIRFDSGFEIWGLPSVPRSLRSKQGHVVIDEAAFVDDLAELLKAAMALLMWGGSVSILSTHNGDDNPFNILIQQIHSGDNSLHHTTITDALSDGLYRRICEVKDKEWTEEKEKQWLSQLEKDYGEAAEEELYCIPTRSGERYFSAALVASCAVKDKPVFRFGADDSFTFERRERREKECRKWFREVRPVLQATELPVCFGEDFARSGDLTVLHFDTELSDGSTDTLCVIELRNVLFAQQLQFIMLCCETLKNFNGAAFDSRGNGQMIAEMMAQEYPGSIFQVMLTRAWYAENMPKLKTAFEDGKTNIPDDLFLKDDYKVVGLVQGVPLITDRTGTQRSKRHGDGCIAKAMSLFAHNELEGGQYQEMTYEAVETPNRFRHRKEDDEW